MKSFLLFTIWLACLQAGAQHLEVRITGPDTSFSVYSAYRQAVKTHPDIVIATERADAAVIKKANITYCVRGKRALKLDIFSPVSKSLQNGIAILILHGGGWRSGNRSQHHALAQRLAALGYTCFTPEYRLSGEALFPAAVYDVKAAIRWVRQQAAVYRLDTAGIVVCGFSAGGTLAALMATTGNMPLFEGTGCNMNLSSAVNALIDIDGTLSFVHPESGEGDDSKKISAATHWFGYSKKDNPGLWEAASPLSYAGPRTPPTLFINSAVARMHAGRDDYIRLLTTQGVYTSVHSFEGAPHSFCLFHPWFEPTIELIHAFLQQVFPAKH